MKRTKYLEPLSHDHHHGLRAVAFLRRELADGTSHRALADYILDLWRDELERHFRDEERLLLPLMTTPETERLATRMLAEHREIKGLIDAIDGDETSRAELLKTFPELLAAHIRFEERELFPKLEAEIPEKDLRKVAEALHAGRGNSSRR